HARLEGKGFAADAIEPDIVHVEAEPVSSAMHIELLVGARFEDRVDRTLAQPEIDETLRDHALGRAMIVVERLAGTHGFDACELRREHQLVDGLLRPREGRLRAGARGAARIDRKSTRLN